MALRFTLKEPKFRGFSPEPPFGLYENGVPLFEIFRLLRGTVDVLDKRTGKLVKITENETRIGVTRSARPVHIFKYLVDDVDSEDSVSFEAFEDFIQRQKHLNKQFFERLRANLTMCLVAKQSGRSTESFLYFYRILEHVSLAFPLTYALNENDFGKAHRFLKDLFQNERDGDLAAMKTFVPRIAQIGGYQNETFEFAFNNCTVLDGSACMTQLRACFDSDSSIVSFDEDEATTEFLVPFNQMHSFIVTVRNRMFHDRVGERNLDLALMGGSDLLCNVVMQEALHWFSKVYAEIVRTLLNREL